MKDIDYVNWKRKNTVFAYTREFGMIELNRHKLDNGRSVFKMGYQDIDITNNIMAYVYNNPLKSKRTI